MSCVVEPKTESPSSDNAWPAEVELVMSALEVGGQHDDRRRHRRMRYRAMAGLRLFTDAPATPAWQLYVRDVSARGMGFITKDRLPLGYGGVVQIPSPSGRLTSIAVTLFRCREIGNGWLEGALYFNREQWVFAAVKPSTET